MTWYPYNEVRVSLAAKPWPCREYGFLTAVDKARAPQLPVS